METNERGFLPSLNEKELDIEEESASSDDISSESIEVNSVLNNGNELDELIGGPPGHTRAEFYQVPPLLHGSEVTGPVEGITCPPPSGIEVEAFLKRLSQIMKMQEGSTRGIREAKALGKILLKVHNYLETLGRISGRSPSDEWQCYAVDLRKFGSLFENLIEDLGLELSGFHILGKRASLYIPFILQFAEKLLDQEDNQADVHWFKLVKYGQISTSKKELRHFYKIFGGF